jgi:hypothetical protein
MADIQIYIEGTGAIVAAESLFANPQINGTWEAESEATRGWQDQLVVTGAIVSIVAGTIQTADILHSWYAEGRSTQAIQKVVIIRGSERLILEGATATDIQKILSQP